MFDSVTYEYVLTRPTLRGNITRITNLNTRKTMTTEYPLKQTVRTIAINLARTDGLINLTRVGLCAAAGIPDGSFRHVTGQTFNEFIDSLRRDPAVANLPAQSVRKLRANPELRREHILESAVQVAQSVGYRKVTRVLVAERAGVSDTLVSRYFATMNQLRQAIMRRAVVLEIPEIVAQGLADGETQARKAPEALKEKAVALLKGA